MTGAWGKPEVEETAWSMPRRRVATIAVATLGVLLVAALPAAIDWSALNRPLWYTEPPASTATTTTIGNLGGDATTTTAPADVTTTARRSTESTSSNGRNGSGEQTGRAPRSPSRSESSTPSGSPSNDGGAGLPGPSANWLALILPLVLSIGAASAGVRAAVQSRSRRGPKPATLPAAVPADPDGIFGPRPDFSAQIDAIDQLLWEIEQERDPRRAIQRVYAAVETGLGNPEMQRQDQETPGVYLRRILGHLGSLDGALAELTRLFELARFSTHAISEAMRARAIELLLTIRAGYANASGRPETVAMAAPVEAAGRRGPVDDTGDRP